MGNKHYLLQADSATAPVTAVSGPLCGAICTVYLLEEYLSEENQAEHEQTLLNNCWEAVNYKGQASNPYKIQRYLTSFFDTNNTLEVSLVAIPGNNPLSAIKGIMLKDAGITSEPELLKDFPKDCEYFMGVFSYELNPEHPKSHSNTESRQKSPGEYHYILLHKCDNGWEYINPHENEWITAGKIEEDDRTLPAGFILGNWKWENFGLAIKKTNKSK